MERKTLHLHPAGATEAGGAVGSVPGDDACTGSPAAPSCPKVGCADTERLAKVYRALGHPARLSILAALAERPEACCGDIVETLPLAQSTVSQHLQVLKEAGLLTCDTRGRCCHYDLDREVLSRASEASSNFLARIERALASPGSATD